ncbi:MAG: glycohydrolase toxin TNT-related protein [Pseudomonadota bacterium]
MSITTNRETILMGPAGAFGVIHKDDLLHGRGEIEHALDRIFHQPGVEEILRANVRRIGLEPAALKRLDRAAFRRWLSGHAYRGAISLALVPDPNVAFSAFVHRQEHSIEEAAHLRDLSISSDEVLPRDIETRFLILMKMVPEHMHGEARAKFEEMVKQIGIEMIAVGLLIWLGAHFVPGLNLVVLALDLFVLSGEAIRAVEVAADCIKKVSEATKKSELEPIAKIMAGAIAVLVVNGLLAKLLRAKQVTRQQTQSNRRGRGRFEKPSVDKKSTRTRRAPRPSQKSASKGGDGPDTPKPSKGSDGPDKDKSPTKKSTAPTKAQQKTADDLGVDPKWVKPDGDVDWPPNDGFDGPRKQQTLEPGTKIDRYGSEKGQYLSPDGTPFEERALPPSSAKRPYRRYEVKKPTQVESGPTKPWFDQKGGGTQHKLPEDVSVQDLLDNGYLKEL